MSITIITCTLNAEKYIKDLILSLENQTDKNFKFLIKDCNSTDETVNLVKNSNLDSQIIISEDFGIYDGLNQAIKEINS